MYLLLEGDEVLVGVDASPGAELSEVLPTLVLHLSRVNVVRDGNGGGKRHEKTTAGCPFVCVRVMLYCLAPQAVSISAWYLSSVCTADYPIGGVLSVVTGYLSKRR